MVPGRSSLACFFEHPMVGARQRLIVFFMDNVACIEVIEATPGSLVKLNSRCEAASHLQCDLAAGALVHACESYSIWGWYGTQDKVRLRPPFGCSILYPEHNLAWFNHKKTLLMCVCAKRHFPTPDLT